MKLCISKSKNSTIFYIEESFRDNSGRSTTRTVGKIGTLKELQEKLGPNVDVKEWCKEYVRKLNDGYFTLKDQAIHDFYILNLL